MNLNEPTTSDWAKAIANRISDEWAGKEYFSEDANLICEIFTQLLVNNPTVIISMVGTGIIEEDYFELLK